MIEVAIISSLREVIGHGLSVYRWEQLLAVAVFLLTLGFLLRFGRFQDKRQVFDRQALRLPDGAIRRADAAVGAAEAEPYGRT